MANVIEKTGELDFDKYRLRNFVDKLIEIDEVKVVNEQVPLRDVSSVIEATPKAVLFKQAGPEKIEMISKAMASRKRLIAAFNSNEEKILTELPRRLANPQKVVEVPSDEAPVHQIKLMGNEINLLKLPFHPQHEFDGSCYISSGIDYTRDPQTGRTNVGSRRLSLRNRTQTGTNITAPSDLKRIYEGCAARKERLPVTFTLAAHPLDMVAATTRIPGDELSLVATLRGETAPVVKSLTNDILVPADAEIIIEGYFDERGYCEPEGPFGEYMGYYGSIHMDPVFTCTAITMRKDAMYQTLQHGSGFVLDQTDSANITGLRIETQAMEILKRTVRDPRAVYSLSGTGGSGTLRVSMKQMEHGEARKAMLGLFASIRNLKHVWVFDEDIDIYNDAQVEWAISTRFQSDQDMVTIQGVMGQTMDPSLQGRRTGAKTGFDCMLPFGRHHEIVFMRCGAKQFSGKPARFQTVEQALQNGPLFYSHLVEAVGSEDGREVAMALDELRDQGKLGRDRDGKYHYAEGSKPGYTSRVGEFYHDPNDGV
jgi:2,5-furandicarboxylate decarboxylase 1